MIKTVYGVIFAIIMSAPLFGQIEDRLRALDESEVNKYVEPMATAIGMSFNSGGYRSAEIPAGFSFSLGAVASFIWIPESQKTFTPDLPGGYNNSRETATVFGNEGGYYAGPEGYIVYPPGINRTTVPAVFPQAAFSFAHTKLHIRFLPQLDVGEAEVGMFGIGLAHSISQYFPASPVDIAVQVLYSRLEVTNIVEQKNLAFNVHGSKSLGVLTLYSGLQYEQSEMNLDYTFRIKDPLNPGEFLERDITANVDGKNNFRFTLGGAVKLLFLVLNADLNVGSQFMVNTGLTFEF